jgi:hypothetical protein
MAVKEKLLVPRRSGSGLGQAAARAERLLAEYLRVWGLRDPSTVAAHCRVWVTQAIDSEEQGKAQASLDSLYRTAVAGATNEIDDWIDHLTAGVSNGNRDAECRRGLVAFEVQTLIDRYPEAMLQYNMLPSQLTQQLQRAARRVVPPVKRMEMPGQPLGQLPAPLVSPPARWAAAVMRALARVVSLKWAFGT